MIKIFWYLSNSLQQAIVCCDKGTTYSRADNVSLAQTFCTDYFFYIKLMKRHTITKTNLTIETELDKQLTAGGSGRRATPVFC